MKIIGVIPARYASSRFPGKPLADICGKPMIWWVYQQAMKAAKLNAIHVATDNTQIVEVCNTLGINVIMTESSHGSSTERLNEIAHKIEADLYVCINGDEPLIDPIIINTIIPTTIPKDTFFVCNLMSKINDPVEALDPANIKVVTDADNYALFFSRNMIPYPKSSLKYNFYKHIGVLAYSIEALEFFAVTKKGNNELIEDINELRFIEHGRKIKMIEVNTESLSVDTPKDLEKVRVIIQKKIDAGQIIL
jgi:3-deoxy-manno-octulosonate cytidylyltransferase (CMP-KDO synthetase)